MPAEDFSSYAIPETHLAEDSVLWHLSALRAEWGQMETRSVGDPAGPGPYASYTFRNGLDEAGLRFEFDFVSRQKDGREVKSSVRAERLDYDALDIQEVILNGKQEELLDHNKIFASFDKLGIQVREVWLGRVPEIGQDAVSSPGGARKFTLKG